MLLTYRLSTEPSRQCTIYLQTGNTVCLGAEGNYKDLAEYGQVCEATGSRVGALSSEQVPNSNGNLLPGRCYPETIGWQQFE